MTTSHQTTSLLDQAREADRVLEGSFDINVETKGPPPLTKTIPFSERLSEQWLLERTYHAQLRNGRQLSVPDLNRAGNWSLVQKRGGISSSASGSPQPMSGDERARKR